MLAVIKINYNLERVGDIADGIARLVMDVDKSYEKDLLEKSRVLEMFRTIKTMLTDAAAAFEREDTKLARTIFKKDEVLNTINAEANIVIGALINEKPETLNHCLNLISMVRKLERAEDQIKNIAEEIIFYIDAKVLKHKKKSKK